MRLRTRLFGYLSVAIVLVVAGTARQAEAGDCRVGVLHEDPAKCIHDVAASGKPRRTFVKKDCGTDDCGVGWAFCPGYPNPWGATQCAPSPLQGNYTVYVSYKNYCPAFGDCCDSYPPTQVAGHLQIFGGEIAGKEACTFTSGPPEGYIDCEPFACGDILCPGKSAIFTPWPTSESAANGSFNWEYQYWDVSEAPLCEEAPGAWAPNYPGHTCAVKEITDQSPDLVFGGLGRCRVRTHASLSGVDCIDPPDWCQVTLTDWGHQWGVSSGGDAILSAGSSQALYVWFDPWWMDQGSVTLSISGGAGVVEIWHNGQLLDGVSSISWTPPHCNGVAGGSSVVIDPIANDDTGFVEFQVKGIGVGEATFTMEFQGCTSTFKAIVLCDLDIDSDNNNGKDLPDQSAYEDSVEMTAPGKIVILDDPAQVPDPNVNNLVPIVVKVAGAVDGARWALTYDAFGNGDIKIWDTKTKGTEFPLATWQTGSYRVLWVEGISCSSLPGDVVITLWADYDGDGYPDASDSVCLTVVRFDLDVDTNRNAVVEDVADEQGEDTWVWGPSGRGAVFMCNNDDDPCVRKPGSWVRDCDWDGISADLADCYPGNDLHDLGLIVLRLPDPQAIPTSESLKVKWEVQQGNTDKFNVFRWTVGTGGEIESTSILGYYSTGQTTCTLGLAEAAANYCIEALDYPSSDWDGLVLLKVSLIDDTHGTDFLVATDTVALRAAPWVMMDNTRQVKRVFAVDTASTAACLDDLESGLAAVDPQIVFTPIPGSSCGNDVWAQDQFNVSWSGHSPDDECQDPGHTIPVTVNWPRYRGISSLWMYAWDTLLASDWGVYGYNIDLPSDANSLNWGGNIQASPDVSAGGHAYPFGRIVMGGPDPDDPDGRTIEDCLWDFLSHQVQSPFTTPTAWLEVGHIDEVVSFVPALTGFKILVADPQLAWQILQSVPDPANTYICPGKDGRWEVSVQAILTDSEGRWEAINDVYVKAKIDTIKQNLKAALGVGDEAFVSVPVLFWSRADAAYAGRCYAHTGNVVNLLVVNDTCFVPLPCGPVVDGIDLFQQEVQGDLAQLGLGVEFLDTWSGYHVALGEIHCGTSTFRQIRDDTRWWEVEP